MRRAIEWDRGRIVRVSRTSRGAERIRADGERWIAYYPVHEVGIRIAR